MRRMGKTTRYLILFCAFLLAVNVFLAFFLIRESSAAIRTQIENRMLDVSNTAAAMLDGDALKTLEAEDVNTAEYQAALKTLAHFASHIELEYIYCVRDLGNGNFVFMIDPDPEAPGAFGSHIPYTEALYQASQGTPSVDQEPYTDQWGRFYSAYSPVYSSEGEISGIVAVDFSAEWYERQISHQVITTLVISGVSLVFAGLMTCIIAARYKKRLRLLVNEMNKVSGGIETLVREAAPGADTSAWKKKETGFSYDEIQALGDTIRSLQDKLSEQISLVRSQAYIDGLTGLGNRLAYEDHVKLLDGEIQKGTAAFSLAIFDLNGLKEINDSLGHDKGDQLIQSAARLISQVFSGEKQYRIGGDEFIVIARGAVPDLADRLKRIHSDADGISLAEGCAVFDPETDADYHMVFNRADVAMYNDKRAFYQTHPDRRQR